MSACTNTVPLLIGKVIEEKTNQLLIRKPVMEFGAVLDDDDSSSGIQGIRWLECPSKHYLVVFYKELVSREVITRGYVLPPV